MVPVWFPMLLGNVYLKRKNKLYGIFLLMKYTIMNNKSTKIYELIFIFPNLLKGKVEAWFCKKKNSKIPLPIFQSLPEERRWQNTTTLNYDVSFQLFNSGPSTFYYLASNICTIRIYVVLWYTGSPITEGVILPLKGKKSQKWSNKNDFCTYWPLKFDYFSLLLFW